MKKTILTSLTLGLILMSCGSDVNNEVKESIITETAKTEVEEVLEIVDTEESVDPVEDEIVSRYNYDLDWDVFKEAVLNNDIQGVSAFAGSDEVDAETLIMLLSDDFYKEKLKNTSYEDLNTVDQDGEMMLEFSASETGVDEDGNEVGSAVMIYFSQGDPSLVLEYYLAAG